ncbi:MAG: sugar ABC transporter permease [Oscillospiraceae bacterium]|nr:sugar ABC transporter permease [Oscillospiraceae bacterium]
MSNTLRQRTREQKAADRKLRTSTLLRKAKNQKALFAMAIPCIILIAIFYYGPLYGWLMAFVRYSPSKGVLGSEFVGLHYFKQFLTDPDVGVILRNTVAMSLMNIVAHSILPLLLALMINEVAHKYFKGTVQTLTYLPHFISFVVVSNVFLELLGTNGPINEALQSMGLAESAVKFWQEPSLFWLLVTLIRAWKEVGWDAILYLSALAAIDETQYEAAAIDGCGRFRRIWYITIPNLLPTVVTLWILNMSGIFAASFDASYMLGNSITVNVAEVIETYVYKMGISMGMYSYSTAISLLQTVIGFILVWLTNKLSQKTTEYSLW